MTCRFTRRVSPGGNAAILCSSKERARLAAGSWWSLPLLDSGLSPLELDRLRGLTSGLVRLAFLLEERKDHLACGGLQHHRRRHVPRECGGDHEQPPGEVLRALAVAEKADRRDG